MSEKQLPRGMKTVFAVGLALLSVPAALIAFFATCMVTAQNAGWGPSNGPIIVGSIAAVLTIAGMIVLTMRVTRGNRPKT